MSSPIEAAFNAAHEAGDALDAAPALDELARELDQQGQAVYSSGLSSAGYALRRAREELDKAIRLLGELLGSGVGRPPV